MGKPAKVFISYRRTDCAHAAGRLRDRLVDVLGDENVFFDIDNIAPGEDFTQKIIHTLEQCDVALIMIGENWNPQADEGSNRKLDDPRDWVRVEVSKALQETIKVIPVLVDRSDMPDTENLSDDLSGLAKKNAAHLRSNDFGKDTEKIIEAIGRPKANEKRWIILSLFLVAAAILSAIAVYNLFPRDNQRGTELTLSEWLEDGMTFPDPLPTEEEVISNEKMVGERYGIINDRPWKRKELLNSGNSMRVFYQPRIVAVRSELYLLYLAKADQEDTIYVFELELGASVSKPRLIDELPYDDHGYYFNSEFNLEARGEFLYYFGSPDSGGRRYRIGSGEQAESADFFPKNAFGAMTSTSPDGRYLIAPIAGGAFINPEGDYALAIRDLDLGLYVGMARYDRKTDTNDILFQQEYEGSWSIGKIVWSDDSKHIFFDNSGAVACIWKYTPEYRILQKIVPEHEALNPDYIRFEGKDYIVYVETVNHQFGSDNLSQNSRVMIATE